MNNNRNELLVDAAKYEGLLGHLKFGWLKLKSLAKIHGFLQALNLLRSNFFSIQFLYRLEAKLADISDPVISDNKMVFGEISGINELMTWNLLSELLQLRGLYGLNQAQARLSKGYVMMYACMDDKLAGFLWLAPHGSNEAGYELKIQEKYIFDAWTFTQFRGKRIFPSLIEYLAETMRKNNFSDGSFIAHAARSNKASISAQIKAGLRITAFEISIVFLGFHKKFRAKTYHTAEN